MCIRDRGYKKLRSRSVATNARNTAAPSPAPRARAKAVKETAIVAAMKLKIPNETVPVSVSYTHLPSVIYGFVGLQVLVKLFLKAGVPTGSCVLAAGILLAVMLLPFLVSSCCETMLKEKEKYELAACALGVSRWYAAATVILPASGRNILLSMILAIGRAMGETLSLIHI